MQLKKSSQIKKMVSQLKKTGLEPGLLSQMQLSDSARRTSGGKINAIEMHQIPTEESNIEMNDSL